MVHVLLATTYTEQECRAAIADVKTYLYYPKCKYFRGLEWLYMISDIIRSFHFTKEDIRAANNLEMQVK